MTASPALLRFDPAQHLSRVNGAEYLKVEHRLTWLRAEHPDAQLETELIEVSAGHAIFRARVVLPTGGSATGWGSETVEDFRDYIEKAEKKAIGRALAALGFGTQFVSEREDGEVRRPVDAPVAIRKPAPAPPSTTPQRADAGTAAPHRPDPAPDAPRPSDAAPAADAMTERQRRYLEQVAHAGGLDRNALDELAQRRFGCAYQWLARAEASALITELQQREP